MLNNAGIYGSAGCTAVFAGVGQHVGFLFIKKHCRLDKDCGIKIEVFRYLTGKFLNFYR